MPRRQVGSSPSILLLQITDKSGNARDCCCLPLSLCEKRRVCVRTHVTKIVCVSENVSSHVCMRAFVRVRVYLHV